MSFFNTHGGGGIAKNYRHRVLEATPGGTNGVQVTKTAVLPCGSMFPCEAGTEGLEREFGSLYLGGRES
jgi:hypothetical protein